MQSKRIWTIPSLLSCLIMNSILLALLFIMAKQILTALRQWVGPFLAPEYAGLPPDARSAFVGLSQLLGETEQYLALVVFGLGLIITLALWLILQIQGRRLLVHAGPSRGQGRVRPRQRPGGLSWTETGFRDPGQSREPDVFDSLSPGMVCEHC